jgi:hypothetical protein
MPHMVESFAVLDRLLNDKPGRQKTLSHCLVEIARFGDYLARACDPPPGNTVMERGLLRLSTLRWAPLSEEKLVGN